MDPDLARVLQGLQEAAAFVKTYRFELSDDYLSLVEIVEAMPRDQSGMDKSGRWLGSRARARSLAGRARLSPPER